MVEVQQQQELRDVLQAAQSALEAGRSQEAVAACQHVLRHYPDAITALRLLGEAYLEAGRSDEAARAFDKALSIDPQNVLARIGLGVIAEDRGEDERAIAQFRLAWEIEPTLPQLRGELVRLYRKRYGAGGRLRLTRVALANLHKRNDDLLRAVAHLRQLHEESPNRPEVTLSLAEALWRQDEDADAAMLCQYLLAERPRTARALLILASIQGDNGVSAEQGVDELLAAVRGLDPDLALTSELIALRPSETLITFAEDVPTVPAFDLATAPSGGTDELLSQGVSGKTKPLTRWEDIASGLASESSGIRSATKMGAIGGALTPPPPATDEVDELFAAIDRELALANEHGTGSLPEIMPFELSAVAQEEHEEAAEWEHPSEDAMMPDPDEPSAVERLTANWENIDNELAAARPRDEAPVGMTGMLSALGDFDADLVPFDVDKASAEEDAVITFDPSKFSLPPLDGEDDDDLALDLDDAALEDDVTPFSLESAGVRTKTSGLSFSDIVSKQEAPLPSNRGLGEADDAEDAAVSSAASIFATRELSSLPPDELRELQASAPDTDALWETRTLVSGTSPIVAAEEAAADAPVTAAVERDDSVVVTAHPEGEGAGAQAVGRVSSSTAELDKLLSTSAPRLVTPPPTDNYPVDATRPLLADETLMLGIAATPTAEDHLVTKAPAVPAADDEVGMDKLFNRLRHRKHERIQTGELLVNRRLQSPGVPGVDTGEITGPLPEAKKREQRLPGAGPAASAASSFVADEAVGEVAAAASFADDLDGQALDVVESAGDTADFLAAIAEESAGAAPLPMVDLDTPEVLVDDSWLTSLVGDTPDPANEWGLDEVVSTANTTAARANGSTAHAAIQPAAADPDEGMQAGGWAALLDSAPADEMPEQPAPPDAWSSPGGGEETPHWGDEGVEASVPLAAAAAPVAAMPVAALAEPLAGRTGQDSVVMRARTTEEPRAQGRRASRPLPPMPRPAAAIVVPRQTEQLSKLSSLVEMQPDNHFARLTLAVAYVSSQQAEQGLNEYRRLIKEASELVPEVVERLKEMIADGEAPPRTHRVLGDAYMKLGQFDLAMSEFQRALTARPRAGR